MQINKLYWMSQGGFIELNCGDRSQKFWTSEERDLNTQSFLGK